MLRHGAREKGGTVLIVHVRLQAIHTALVMLPNSLFAVEDCSGPSRIALGSGNITCCSGVSTTVEALRQAQFH
jgi:hypothetical protein